MQLQDKTAVLTGASGGIGEAIAQELAAAGARLILVGRREHALANLVGKLPTSGHRAIAADLATSQGRKTVIAACCDGIDLLVNNAGVNHFGLFSQQTSAQLEQMLQVNALSPILLTQALLPQMLERESVVVMIGSGFGSIGFAGYCGYSASKFALRGFAESLRRELADSTVSVKYLAPRATDTGMNSSSVDDMNRALGNATDSPQRVAKELMALLESSKGARYIGWPERFFVKLNGLLPSVVDKALFKKLLIIRRHAVAASKDSG